MNTNAKAVKRVLVCQKLPTTTADLIMTAKSLLSSMTRNPDFPTPDPALQRSRRPGLGSDAEENGRERAGSDEAP
jgi:hypothetical protein